MICDASIHDFGLIKSEKALSGIVKEMYLRVHIWWASQIILYSSFTPLCTSSPLFMATRDLAMKTALFLNQYTSSLMNTTP